MSLPTTASGVVVAPTGGVAIEAAGVRHAYTTGGDRTHVLDALDLDVPAGGYVAITGPSGAGKSTLLSLLGGLEPLQAGTIRVGERDLAGLGGDALAAYRRETVGFVFQHYGLVEVLSALENVELALTLTGRDRASRRAWARDLLEQVGLGHRASHRPTALSGGERQRVAIARALANRPRLLLADEPTGNLDEDAAGHVLDLLEALRAERGCTLLVVTHNRRVAERAEEVRRLVGGRWVER
jgi:putative ABC transport system ATP-binding protein